MTVLTGETGAGKSIIIDALGLLAGGRGSSDLSARELISRYSRGNLPFLKRRAHMSF